MKSLLFTAALLLSLPAAAHPSHDYYSPPAPAVEPDATVIPDTYPEVVAALTERLSTVEAALDASKIADVYKGCGELTDLAAAISSKTSGLSEEAQATAAETAARVQLQVEAILTYANGGDVAGAKEAIATAKAEIEGLDGLDGLDD